MFAKQSVIEYEKDGQYMNGVIKPMVNVKPVKLGSNTRMSFSKIDEVLEMLYAKVNGEMIRILTPQKIQNEEQTARQIARGDAMLVKMHGDARDGEYVLTKEEYDKAYGEGELDMKRPLPAFLRKILLSFYAKGYNRKTRQIQDRRLFP